MPLTSKRNFRLLTGLTCALLAGCGEEEEVLTAADRQRLERLGPLTALPPPSPTNAVAEEPRARRLGQQLFFDARMSSDGNVSCASCHKVDHGLADPNPVSLGAFGRAGTRHASTLINVAYNDFQFWDGRTDSLWSQPLQAIEGAVEMDFTRAEVAHFISDHYRAGYEALFGPLPSLASVPRRARPGDGAWETMPAADQTAVNRIFANTGKVLEAFMRQLVCDDTRLDRYLAGDTAALTEAELRGARVFVREDRGRCLNCHDGTNLTNNAFHNLGIPQGDGPLDEGRYEGVARLLEDPFNGAGAFSDDPAAGQRKLRFLVPVDSMRGAFKTPTLRGVGQRPPYGTLGTIATLEDWIAFHVRGGGTPDTGRFPGQKDGMMRPLDLSPEEQSNLAAFLRTLDCPPLPDALVTPISSATGGG